MSQGIRRPFEAVDYGAIARAYPPPPEYFETAWFMEPEQIERMQLTRLRARADQAAKVPFFARRWAKAGFSPAGLNSLEDLWQAPFYTVEDLRRNIEEHPPWGDYQGVTPDMAAREPMRVFMSGGTTGNSRPTFYTQWDREVGTITLARQLYMQGVRPGDVVLNSWAYGLHNGAFSFDEAAYRWLNCVVIPTSTGNVTSSQRQVELAREYRASAIMTTGDYLLRLAEVAREMGLDPKKDLYLKALPNIGDPKVLQETFGLPYYNGYGFHEVQCVSTECPAHQGLHIFEDCYIIQIVLDPESGERLPDRETGAMVVTELYKTGSPQFRYNIMDLSFLHPREQCACGSWLRRMGPFAGRGDNMVKLRGINVWPEAIGELALAVPGVAQDYFVRAVRDNNRDDLILSVVSEVESALFSQLAATVADRLKDKLGVKIQVEVVRPGALDAWTGLNSAPKLKRFRDER